MGSWTDHSPCLHCYTPWSADVLGVALLGINNPALGATVSTVWPAANLALFFPLRLPGRFNVARFSWNNGATAAGNVDAGLYSWAGKLIVSTGATAQGTINVQQIVDTTDVLVGPGEFWLALMCTSASATMFGNPLTSPYQRFVGLQEMATSGTLPATATFAANTTAGFVPVFSMTDRTT